MAISTSGVRGHSPSASTSAIPTSAPYYTQQGQPPATAPPMPTAYATRPPSPTIEQRLRSIESLVRPLGSLPNALNNFSTQLSTIQRTAEATYGSVAERLSTAGGEQIQPRETRAEVPDRAWQSYRNSAWPLTPWLVGLRDAQGLPGLVIIALGNLPMLTVPDGTTKKDCEDATAEVYKEVGRLVAQRTEWTREEVRALGVFATWFCDLPLAAMAISHARAIGLDRIRSARKTPEDWREWIYLSLMDKICHAVDFVPAASNDILFPAWQDHMRRTSYNTEASVRDRDQKLLAWLEYAEGMQEILQAQIKARREILDEERRLQDDRQTSPTSQRSAAGTPADRSIEIWRKWSPRWEAWVQRNDVRSDPILALHRQYATLYSTSPSILGSKTVWQAMAQVHEGMVQLERARDAALAVIQSISSGEIARTLTFSFALFRPLLGLAMHTLLCLAITSPNGSTPAVPPQHLSTVIRSTWEVIAEARPFDQTPPVTAPVRGTSRDSRATGLSSAVTDAPPLIGGEGEMQSLLKDIVMDGTTARAQELLGAEPGPELWKRLLG